MKKQNSYSFLKTFLAIFAFAILFLSCSGGGGGGSSATSFSGNKNIKGDTFRSIETSSGHTETVTIAFNNNGTFDYKSNLKRNNGTEENATLSGTYKIHNSNKKIKLEAKTSNADFIDLLRDFNIMWSESGELELHAGFLDSTLYLSLKRI